MSDKKQHQGANDSGRVDAARNATSDAFASARDKVGGALDDARERASTVIHEARDTVSDTSEKAVEVLSANPLATLIGGLAAGALAATLLPRSERETQLLGGLGQRLTGAARGAVGAARDAGIDRLDELGLTPDKARDTVANLVGDVTKAATSAGAAAASSVAGGKTTV